MEMTWTTTYCKSVNGNILGLIPILVHMQVIMVIRYDSHWKTSDKCMLKLRKILCKQMVWKWLSQPHATGQEKFWVNGNVSRLIRMLNPYTHVNNGLQHLIDDCWVSKNVHVLQTKCMEMTW